MVENTETLEIGKNGHAAAGPAVPSRVEQKRYMLQLARLGVHFFKRGPR
jgi:hypothetical protein